MVVFHCTFHSYINLIPCSIKIKCMFGQKVFKPNMQNQEQLERALGRLRKESQDHQNHNQARNSSANADSHVQIQQEIVRCKSKLTEMEKRLRIFEGDPSEITALCEAEYRKQVLQESLKRVRNRKQALAEKYNSRDAKSNTQASSINVSNMVTANPNNIFDWLPPKDPQVQIMNFMNFNGIPSHRQNEHVNRANVIDHDNNVNGQRSEFGQIIDMNLSPWTQFYPAGNGPMLMTQLGERAFNESFHRSVEFVLISVLIMCLCI